MPRIRDKFTLIAGSALAVLSLAMGATVLAQSTGGVKGKVRNLAGERIAGATVTARQNSSDVRSVRADSSGEFLLSGLEPGTYNIVFEAKGYSSGVKYGVDVKANKVSDLGDRLFMQVDRGTQVFVRGSVFFKDGTSVTAAKVLVEKIDPEGRARKIANLTSNIYGEFAFSQPEGAAKFRITASYKDVKASKEIEVDSAAVYRLAISLDATRQEK